MKCFVCAELFHLRPLRRQRRGVCEVHAELKDTEFTRRQENVRNFLLLLVAQKRNPAEGKRGGDGGQRVSAIMRLSSKHDLTWKAAAY